MEKTKQLIDIFVNIVDNYGDMGFACEFIRALEDEYSDQYEYTIWTNDVTQMQQFVRQVGVFHICIVDLVEFGIMRKSAIGISLLHAPIPDLVFFAEKALILRIDYLSLDPTWIENNEREYIGSTVDRQIIELIPSVLDNSAGFLPLRKLSGNISSGKHIVIFAYPETLNLIDWESFPDDTEVFVFGKIKIKRKNIISLDFISSDEFYSLLDSSEFAIIRGEVTFAHMIQTGVPFFWDMYRGIGGFPDEQSEQYLSMIDAKSKYRDIHHILNGQKSGKIMYGDFLQTLSYTHFPLFRIHNLIHTVKKHIDRFNNSI